MPFSKDEKTQELLDEAEAKAKGYFREGLNCAECVMLTYMDIIGTDLQPEVIRLATGFGGGMGHTKNTCGAITGAVLAMGLSLGRPDPFAKETPAERAAELTKIYPAFGEMIRELEDKYGTLICRELTAPHGEFEGKERRKSCQQIVGECARLAAKYG